MRRKMVAGNWKMNGGPASAQVLSDIAAACPAPACDVLICPPAPLIAGFAALNSGIAIGAQDCHAEVSGAHTGDIAAELLAECGASAIIVGHSERRADHHECDAVVAAKARAVWRAGLIAIICVGETEAQKTSGLTLDVIGSQLAGSIPDGATPTNTVVAYEPVWAIGTGLTPTLDDIAEVHGFIRKTLSARFGAPSADATRLLYGGSVKASNAVEIFAIEDVDGGLVGGASLKAADLAPIIDAAG